MAVVSELICSEADGTISFGNYLLDTKSKKSDFEYNGDLYKVKTFKEITKLERNEMFVYESVPGTTVHNLKVTDNGVEFKVEGAEDAQITLELEPESEYKVSVDEVATNGMRTNLGGKLVLSVELGEGKTASVKVEKV
ncbi:MAG: endosialidase [Lachnospiraceae bacterium]